jgi:isoleucyl-tRNA synthetase
MAEQSFPADLFLEGKDQHRGYFQSSFLISMALYDESCMKAIITHGFTVDASGRKMSKSLGNTVAPQDLIKKMGIDGLRLWVSSVDLSSEVVVSDNLLQNVQEVYRKIRNTCRFLVSNLYDFEVEKDAVPFEQLKLLDRIGIIRCNQWINQVRSGYGKYDFTAVFHALADYCAVDLSAFYLDIVKDRLYVELASGFKRRSAQTVCHYILNALTTLMAPILSFTAELVSDCYQKNKTESIHLQKFPEMGSPLQKDMELLFVEGGFDFLLKLRSALLKEIELLREKQIIKHSLEARVLMLSDFTGDERALWKKFAACFETPAELEAFFAELLIVSQLSIVLHKDERLKQSECEGLWVFVETAPGVKCPRCWQWQLSDHKNNLCNRCQNIVE